MKPLAWVTLGLLQAAVIVVMHGLIAEMYYATYQPRLICPPASAPPPAPLPPLPDEPLDFSPPEVN